MRRIEIVEHDDGSFDVEYKQGEPDLKYDGWLFKEAFKKLRLKDKYKQKKPKK